MKVKKFLDNKLVENFPVCMTCGKHLHSEESLSLHKCAKCRGAKESSKQPPPKKDWSKPAYGTHEDVDEAVSSIELEQLLVKSYIDCELLEAWPIDENGFPDRTLVEGPAGPKLQGINNPVSGHVDPFVNQLHGALKQKRSGTPRTPLQTNVKKPAQTTGPRPVEQENKPQFCSEPMHNGKAQRRLLYGKLELKHHLCWEHLRQKGLLHRTEVQEHPTPAQEKKAQARAEKHPPRQTEPEQTSAPETPNSEPSNHRVSTITPEKRQQMVHKLRVQKAARIHNSRMDKIKKAREKYGMSAENNQQKAISEVKKVINSELGSGHDLQVVYDPELKSPTGVAIEAMTTPEGKIIVNAATVTSEGRLREALREEVAHRHLESSEGRKLVNKFLMDTPLSAQEITKLKKDGYDGDAFDLANEFIAKQARKKTSFWDNLVDYTKEVLNNFGLRKLTRDEAARSILRRLKDIHGKTSVVRVSMIPKVPNVSSPFIPTNRHSLVEVTQTVRVRSNKPEEQKTYLVSFNPSLSLNKDDQKAEINVESLEQARALNTSKERQTDYKELYKRAASLTKFAEVKKKGQFKLESIPIVSLTKGCQRAMVTAERVNQGVLPKETRIEACYGGDCWVNKTFNSKMSNFENMEVRNLQVAKKERIADWLKNKKTVDWLNSGPLIRMGQQGCDSHLFASGVALEWLKQAKAAGVTKKTIFISAGYAPVTDEQYAELKDYKDMFEIHFSNSGWFHKNEVMLRLAEFQAAKKAGVPAVIRLITNKDQVSNLAVPNEQFLLDEMKKLGVQQHEVLETPFHDDGAKGKPRSKPTGEYKFVCCETGKCGTCKYKCMAAVKAAGASTATTGITKLNKEKNEEVRGSINALLLEKKK